MLIDIRHIWIDPERARDDHGDVNAMANSLLRMGQLQPILVKPRDDEGQPWELVAGERRFLAMGVLVARAAFDPAIVEQAEKWNLEIGYLEATTRESMRNLDPIIQLLMENEENFRRKDFDWKERVKIIKKVHDAKCAEDPEWDVAKTAALFDVTPKQIYLYLGIVEDAEIFTSAAVQGASTLSVAAKQATIHKEIAKRKRIVAATKTQSSSVSVGPDYNNLAGQVVYNGDCRDWIKTIPEGGFSFFHWDPPFGGREGGGGAFTGHEAIEMDPAACMELMAQMRDEIWRTLKPGGWLVFWYTPAYYQWVRDLLQGHHFCLSEEQYDNETGEMVDEGGDFTCVWCGVAFGSADHLSSYTCSAYSQRMWVNPYPNYWLKTNRAADGHEIRRFFTKQTECFLYACKSDEPILMISNRSNVFPYDGVSKDERRGVAHKPAGLLRDILSTISVSGELGGDAGSHSGSIIEAAYGSGRRILTAEISDTYAGVSREVAESVLKSTSIKAAADIAEWLK